MENIDTKHSLLKNTKDKGARYEIQDTRDYAKFCF
jgi:hypothetical protein